MREANPHAGSRNYIYFKNLSSGKRVKTTENPLNRSKRFFNGSTAIKIHI
jgi:hypothetical protein